MTIPLRRLAAHLPGRGLHASLLVALVGTSACRTLTGFAVEKAAEAVAGDEVEVYDRGDRYDVLVDGERAERPDDAATSAYVYGPVPGWERGLRATASAPGSPYFFTRFSTDGCPTYDLGNFGNLFGGTPLDPFGPLARPGGEEFFDGNTLDIEDDYVPFGRVPLGRMGPEARLWSPPSMFGMAGGTCAFPGIPLLSFGPRTDDPVISR